MEILYHWNSRKEWESTSKSFQVIIGLVTLTVPKADFEDFNRTVQEATMYENNILEFLYAETIKA
jgi:hypothetical protein